MATETRTVPAPSALGEMPKLTKASIEAAIKTGKRVEIADPTVPGLRVVVTSAGVATFAIRTGGRGGSRRVSLGRFGSLTLDEARRLARARLAEIATGVDPIPKRRTNVEVLRMRDLFGDGTQQGWFLGQYVLTAGRLGGDRGSPKTPEGIYNDRQIIRKHLRSRPALMAKRLDAVSVEDLMGIQRACKSGVWRKVRNILMVAFEYALELGAIQQNIVKRKLLRPVRGRKLERYLSPVERRRLAAELDRAEQIGQDFRDGVAPHFVRAIRLLLLTGLRRGDVLALRWEHLDWRLQIARLPVGKTGARDVPLSSQTIAFLRAEQARDGGRKTGLVLRSSTGTKVNPDNLSRAWLNLRKRCGLDDVRLHDCRHSWASDAVSAGVPLYVVGKVLGHSQPSTTARYAHVHDRALRDGLELAGRAIEIATRG